MEGYCCFGADELEKWCCSLEGPDEGVCMASRLFNVTFID